MIESLALRRRLTVEQVAIGFAIGSIVDAEGHQEEVLLMASAMLHAYENMYPRRRSDPAADPRSAQKYIEAVQWDLMGGGGGSRAGAGGGGEGAEGGGGVGGADNGRDGDQGCPQNGTLQFMVAKCQIQNSRQHTLHRGRRRGSLLDT